MYESQGLSVLELQKTMPKVHFPEVRSWLLCCLHQQEFW